MTWTSTAAAPAAAGARAALPRAGIRATVTMWTLLALGDLLLATRGFTGIHRIVQRWPVRARRAADGDAATPEAMSEEARRARAAAMLWYVKEVKCLQSAFATTCYLRWRGAPAELVVAVQKLPFRAHAWAEHAGSPVDETPAVTAQYQPIARWRAPGA